jgi:hypothetical protein
LSFDGLVVRTVSSSVTTVTPGMGSSTISTIVSSMISATGFRGRFGAAGLLRASRFACFLAVVLRAARLALFPRTAALRLLPLRRLDVVFFRAAARRFRFAMTIFSRQPTKAVPILRFVAACRQYE